jgi:hypothetical protein
VQRAPLVLDVIPGDAEKILAPLPIEFGLP